MPVHVICKCHKVSVKTKQVILWTRLTMVCLFFWHKRASNSIVNSPFWPEFELVRDVTPVQIIYKFHKYPIKTRKAILRTRSNMVFSALQRVTRKSFVRSGRNSNLSEILWLPCLPASWKIILSNVKSLSSGQHFLNYKFMGKVSSLKRD